MFAFFNRVLKGLLKINTDIKCMLGGAQSPNIQFWTTVQDNVGLSFAFP